MTTRRMVRGAAIVTAAVLLAGCDGMTTDAGSARGTSPTAGSGVFVAASTASTLGASPRVTDWFTNIAGSSPSAEPRWTSAPGASESIAATPLPHTAVSRNPTPLDLRGPAGPQGATSDATSAAPTATTAPDATEAWVHQVCRLLDERGLAGLVMDYGMDTPLGPHIESAASSLDRVARVDDKIVRTIGSMPPPSGIDGPRVAASYMELFRNTAAGNREAAKLLRTTQFTSAEAVDRASERLVAQINGQAHAQVKLVTTPEVDAAFQRCNLIEFIG